VVGFNSRPESGAEAAAEVLEVELVTYSIIYELLDGIKLKMEDLLEPIRTEKKARAGPRFARCTTCEAGVVAGSSVLEGTIKRPRTCGCGARTSRVHAGKIARCAVQRRRA